MKLRNYHEQKKAIAIFDVKLIVQKFRSNEHLTEEEREDKMRIFVKANEKEIKEFGWLKKYDDSKAYMTERPYLACEETANYLVIHCLNLELQEKCAAMEQVAHQCICVQYLLELAKQLDVDPRSCISSFFTKYVYVSIIYYTPTFFKKQRHSMIARSTTQH